MKASEVILELARLLHREGDLDVVVHVTSEGQTFPLESTVDVDNVDGDYTRQYFVLATEPLEV